jgi:hypothetical protein
LQSLMKYSVNTQSLNGTLLFRVHWLQSKSTYNAGSSFGINVMLLLNTVSSIFIVLAD